MLQKQSINYKNELVLPTDVGQISFSWKIILEMYVVAIAE